MVQVGRPPPRKSLSFVQMLVGMFGWVLRPRRHLPRVEGPFPGTERFQSETPDVVLDEAVLPAARLLRRFSAWSRVFQQGSIQVYLLYILVILIVLLLWH